jgi:hypothetical protein
MPPKFINEINGIRIFIGHRLSAMTDKRGAGI